MLIDILSFIIKYYNILIQHFVRFDAISSKIIYNNTSLLHKITLKKIKHSSPQMFFFSSYAYMFVFYFMFNSKLFFFLNWSHMNNAAAFLHSISYIVDFHWINSSTLKCKYIRIMNHMLDLFIINNIIISAITCFCYIFKQISLNNFDI